MAVTGHARSGRSRQRRSRARAIVDDLSRGTEGHQVRVVGLAGGYVGYVDSPERVHILGGESPRMWFGPELLEAL